MLNAQEPRHSAAKGTLDAEKGPFLLSPFVLAELDHLILRQGVDAELDLLRDVGSGAYELAPFTADDVTQAASLVERYRDLGIALADASIAVIAERAGTKRILTLDERHFRALRPLSGGHFTLLPADVT